MALIMPREEAIDVFTMEKDVLSVWERGLLYKIITGQEEIMDQMTRLHDLAAEIDQKIEQVKGTHVPVQQLKDLKDTYEQSTQQAADKYEALSKKLSVMLGQP